MVDLRACTQARQRAQEHEAETDACLEAEFAVRRDPGRVLARDALARARGLDADARLRLMECHPELLTRRDDLALVYVNLLLDVGRDDDAWAIIVGHTFQPFEGGEGQALAAFDRASCRRARRTLQDRPFEMIEMLRAGLVPPPNLGEERVPGVPQAERHVLLGDALAAIGDRGAAEAAWLTAAVASPAPSLLLQTSENEFWTGVAHLRLGDHAAASRAWEQLDASADDIERRRDEPGYRHEWASRLRTLATRGRTLTAAQEQQAARGAASNA